MNACFKLPPDKFQRYFTAQQVVAHELVEVKQRCILDLGANEGLVHDVFPDDFTVELDLEPSRKSWKFIHGRAQELPFPDRAFDAVIALDLLEHVPASDRKTIISEIARVFRRVAVISYPADSEPVHQCEHELNEMEMRLFGNPNRFLKEHFSVEPVDHDSILKSLKAGFKYVDDRRNFDLREWVLSVVIEMYLAVTTTPLVLRSEIYILLNHLSSMNVSHDCYRMVAVASRNREVRFFADKPDLLQADYLRTFGEHFAVLYEKFKRHRDYTEHLEQQIEVVKSALDDNKARKEYQQIEEYCRKLKSQCEEFELRISELNSHIVKVEKDSESKNAELKRLEKELKETGDELDRSTDYARRIEKDRAFIKDRNEWVERKISELQRERIEFMNQLNHCRTEYERSTMEHDKLKRDFINLKEETRKLQETILRLQRYAVGRFEPGGNSGETP